MKKTLLMIVLSVFLFQEKSIAQMRTIVRQVGDNADLYLMPDVDNPAVLRRLTTHTAVDNHPTVRVMTVPPYDTVVVWSSDRSGTFELYRGTLPDLEATVVQLTFNGYSDRHPHFSHSGNWLVYTSKYRYEPSTVCPKSECSIPVSTPCGWYEGLHIMNMNTLTIFEIDLRSMPITGGGFWPATFATWVGHPAFSMSDDRIIFSAALDEGGTDWEVYSVDWTSPNIVSDLTRHTQGTLYPAGPNPIQMSAGGHYMSMGMDIIYSSTKTPLGNSQLFIIPASSVNVPVNPVNQVDFHYANDYVPDQLSDGRIFFTSDQGPNAMCQPPDTAATDDLDMFLINPDGSGRTNVTNNDAVDEMALIGDEVSWFCGIKPNLSECTFYPKIWNICWFREFYRMGTNPGYMPNFPKRDQYTQAWNNVSNYMITHQPGYWQQILQAMSQYDGPCNFSWMNVPSFWILPGIMNKWDPTLPANPALISPENHAVFTTPAIIPFMWTPVPGAGIYGMQISLTPDFLSPIQNITGLPSPQCTLTLPPGLYYWRASATEDATSWSTVYMFTVSSPLPITRSLQNMVIEPMQSFCADASMTIFVAGGGTEFMVMPDGDVTLIAGMNILFQPHTTVMAGGHLHGYIAPSGPYCGAPSQPAGAPPVSDSKDGSDRLFRVWPNPTPGTFSLQMVKDLPFRQGTVDVFSPLGDQIIRQEISADETCQFSLAGRVPGVYLVRILTGDRMATAKVVKL